MDYKIVLDFDNKEYSVEPAIKLKKNERYIDNLLIKVISSVPNIHYLKMKFKGFITLVEDTLVLIPKGENEYFVKFKIDGRFTKDVDNGFLSFELFDINNQSISISDKFDISVDMSTFPSSECEDTNPSKKSHLELLDRELPDQHPKQSIIGLEDDLTGLTDADDKINKEIINLKDRLQIYWSIYFKLLICQSANIQMIKINNMNKPIQIENQTIIKNLDEIVEIISTNIQKMNIDETFLDLILQFITHVLAYKCLKQLNFAARARFLKLQKSAKSLHPTRQ